ncbi:expressed hypothetical protein [Trichoplax adhaerens]|uniref:Charged multivesicular body protein 4b n=1 Tax=Trichoplax adhaerens TaxID=10228 RepID=B3RV79_TRIAD|nr:expressed hypothetical protein [Trichoplax adhaerens]EDV25455.1 expressed hypothetical protein [Trichoplax adhaerens]|eukprot:XP_002111488.1 expressed hypothetical protein [Trichoplax adhaerens]
MGKKKQGGPPTTSDAIQKLRETEEMLEKKSSYIEGKIDSEITIIKKHVRTNKRAALNALKRKKRLEKQLGQIDGTLSTIEYQREALENANTNTEVLKTMGFAAKALKSAHQQLNADDVHDLMDDIAEQQEVANEISNAISTGIGFGQDLDEDELNAELEELEQEELDSELLDVEKPEVQLPTVPSDELPTVKQKAKPKPEADEELAELEAWAS